MIKIRKGINHEFGVIYCDIVLFNKIRISKRSITTAYGSREDGFVLRNNSWIEFSLENKPKEIGYIRLNPFSKVKTSIIGGVLKTEKHFQSNTTRALIILILVRSSTFRVNSISKKWNINPLTIRIKLFPTIYRKNIVIEKMQ